MYEFCLECEFVSLVFRILKVCLLFVYYVERDVVRWGYVRNIVICLGMLVVCGIFEIDKLFVEFFLGTVGGTYLFGYFVVIGVVVVVL